MEPSLNNKSAFAYKSGNKNAACLIIIPNSNRRFLFRKQWGTNIGVRHLFYDEMCNIVV